MLSLIIAALTGFILLRYAEWFIRTLIGMRTNNVLLVDPDSGTYSWVRAPLKENRLTLKVNGEERTYLTDAAARLTGKRGSLWVIHKRHGWNLRPPNDREAVGNDSLLQLLLLANPAQYAYAILHNESQDSLNSNNEHGNWIVQVAPFALLGLVVTMAGVMFLVYKLSNAGGV